MFALAALAACSAFDAPAATSIAPTPINDPAPPTASAAPTPTAVGCPAEASLAIVIQLDSASRLACFGDAALTLEGIAGCGGCGGVDTRIATPTWLAGKEFDFLNDAGLEVGRLALHFRPPLRAPAAGSILRVTGHFDDPQASECRIAEDPGDTDGSPVPMPVAEAVQICRERFVVESFEILGMGSPPVG